jgi:hypothetical protein
MIHNSSSITDFSRFIEAMNAPVQSHQVEIDLNHKVYEILLEIEFERNQINNLTAISGGAKVAVHQNLLTALRSDIQKKSDELFQLIQQSNKCINLGYTDIEDLDTSAPEFYTKPQSIEELLKEVGLYDLVILLLAQKFIDYLAERNEDYAEQILTVNSGVMLRLYSLSQSDQRDELVGKVTFQECNVAALASLEQDQRSFALSPAGITGFYKKIFDYNWIKGQSSQVLSFLSNVEVIGKVIRDFLPINTVVSIFQKFGKEDSESILKGGVENYRDLDAWDSLSKEEFKKLKQIAKKGFLDYWNLSSADVIAMFKVYPEKLSALASKQVVKAISENGQEYGRLLLDNADPLKYLYFISPATIQLINAIGLSHTDLLYTNHFETFSALYSQGEWFLASYRSDIRALINMHVESKLSPTTVDLSKPSSKLEFHQKIKEFRSALKPPPPPVPSRRESLQVTISASSSSSSWEL